MFLLPRDRIFGRCARLAVGIKSSHPPSTNEAGDVVCAILQFCVAVVDLQLSFCGFSFSTREP